jgi:hypothetical protein
VEELAEVGETLVGEGVVVVLPRELGLDEALGSEGLHRLDDLEVTDGGDVRVGRAVEVLGRDEDTVLEEGLVDLHEWVSIAPRDTSINPVLLNSRCGGSAW